MKQAQAGFPLFNRIVVFVLSLALVIGCPIAIVQAGRKGELDAVTLFVFAVFFLIGCGCVWLSLFCRNRSPAQLAEEQSFPSAEQPDISQDALVYRFSNGVKSAAIHVDTVGRLIHFHNCHIPRQFLASAAEWFSCDVDDVQAAHVFRYRGESLTVVTSSGKALIPGISPGYAELRDTVKELVPFTRPGFSTDHPMMGVVYVCGALTGMATGFLLTPRNATDSTLGLIFLVGAALGVAGSYGLVRAADRSLKADLAQPIGFATVGAMIGLGIARALTPLIGWDVMPIAAIASLGTVAGAWFGVCKQSKERRSTSVSGFANKKSRTP
ncbi:MAG: hypothetical protein ISQ06_07125 [Planctomycetaceae bacterium]|nr:hypothetical protein [Planctomycetaceae bacterium]